MAEPGMDWWLERLDVAEWKNRAKGRREVMAVCPVHNGGSLHIEESGNRALVHCFGCDAKFAEIKAAAEDGEADDDSDEAGVVSIGLKSASAGVTTISAPVRSKPADLKQASNVRTSVKDAAPEGTDVVTTSGDPLAWTATRCGMTLAELKALNLPLEARGQRVAFTFGPTVEKLRGQATGKRKDILWVGGYTPPLWPVPEKPGTEIVVCEGEFDAIVLRAAGYDAYSITGGAGNVPDAATFRVLRDLNVARVHVLFDEDSAGQKGRDAVLEVIREADIETVPSRVVGIQPLMGEKDARDVAVRVGAVNVRIEDAIEDEVHSMDDVEAAQPEPLLIDYLHPQEHTILYGDGGTGKGVIAAWWVAKLVGEESKRVLIVDYEAHARHEWRPRLEAFLTKMGKANMLKDHVYLCQPTKPIWEIGDWLRDMARRVQADYVVVDSVTYACIEDAEVSKTAIKYSGTIARLGLPVLSIAHVTKADANPRHPFGSVYWSNGARVTIAVSRKEAARSDSPRILTNFKSNQRAEFAKREVDWSWVDKQDGPPDELVITDLKQSEQTLVDAEMSAHPEYTDGSMTDREVNDALYAAFPDMPKNNIRQCKARWVAGANSITLKSTRTP